MAEILRKVDIDLLKWSEAWSKEEYVEKYSGARAKINSEMNRQISKEPVFLTDIAQSRFFTVFIDGFKSFKVPGSNYGDFIPIKSIDLSYTNYNNLSIPVGIFGDFPLLNRKSVSTVKLTCYDTGYGGGNDKSNIDSLEKSLLQWESSCFIEGTRVNYLSDIIRTLKYTSYSVDGKKSMTHTMSVIPAGSLGLSRSYEEDGAKLVSFSLVVVGFITDVLSDSTIAGEPYGPGGMYKVSNVYGSVLQYPNQKFDNK